LNKNNIGAKTVTEKESILRKQIEVISEQAPNKAEKKKSTKGKNYLLDLRVQSPEALGSFGLGKLEIAPALIRLCKAKGIDVIGVADFFSANFVDKALQAAVGSGISVVPGVVIRCRIDLCDDVNLLCLFDSNTGTHEIHKFLNSIGVSDSDFGSQKLVLSTDVSNILQEVDKLNGICIPTRMDRTPYSMMAIPELVEKHGFRTFDLCYAENTNQFKAKWPKIRFQFVSFSNASSLAQVGSRAAKMKLSNLQFSSIKGGFLDRVASLTSK
jgi:PHP family Zn ribbon phosphoesterase